MQPARVIDAIPLPSVLIDQSERIVAANSAATALLGRNLLGRNYITMLRQPALISAVEKALRDGQAQTVRYKGVDGEQDTLFRATCRRIEPEEDTEPGAVLVCFEDVTHLEQAGQMRRDFVANVSHELRTPLTALMGFIETLRGPAKDDVAARTRFLDIMDDETQRMNRLVGDLLSLSRVEGEQRVRPTEKVVLDDILMSTVHSLRPLADGAGVSLDLRAISGPIHLVADPDQLRQVFTNLVENAVKYGGSGQRVEITVNYTARDPALRQPAVHVHVIDYGPGIDPLHIPRLTERFYRADSHRSRQLGGTGLGLAIVKHIINRHRGRLRIESKIGQGSVFKVTLPSLPSTPNQS